jgi:hypothetical protein
MLGEQIAEFSWIQKALRWKQVYQRGGVLREHKSMKI